MAGVMRLVFMTDETRVADPVSVLKHLPKGTLVIFRDYDCENRREVAFALRRETLKQGLYLLVAGDEALARAVKADGIHLPEYQLFKGSRRPRFPIVSAACHNRRALVQARKCGADLVLLSPVFPTASHENEAVLGVHRFARMAKTTRIPVIALGGITGQTAKKLKGLGLYGIAGISVFAELL